MYSMTYSSMETDNAKSTPLPGRTQALLKTTHPTVCRGFARLGSACFDPLRSSGEITAIHSTPVTITLSTIL